MEKNSRTKNSLRNMVWTLVNRFVMLIFPFAIRTIMIQKMGSEYLGLNSLFTSILQVINLSEMGFGTAMIFSLYKPIAANDVILVNAYLQLYKKVYRIIGIITLILGLMVLPLIPYLINGSYPNDINLYVIYMIFLLNSVFSFFMWAHKGVILNAYQRNDLCMKSLTVCNFFMYIFQIAILILTKNYYLYALMLPICTISNNLITAVISKKKFPKYFCQGYLPQNKRMELKKQIVGLISYKICGVFRNSFDNIIISSYIGLVALAIFNNYYYILSFLISLFSILLASITASVGNSMVMHNKEKNLDDFNKFLFGYMWVVGICTIFLFCLMQPFMNLWMGDSMLLSQETVILFCFYFYLLKLGDLCSTYREAAGLWWQDRYRPIIEAILNLILSILFVKYYGINGVLIGTIISLIIINIPWSTYILYKHYFNASCVSYLFEQLKYLMITLIVGCITYFITLITDVENYFQRIIVNFFICLIIPNIFYFVIYHKDKNFNLLKNFILLHFSRK